MPAARGGGRLDVLTCETAEFLHMSNRASKRLPYLVAVLLLAVLLGACGGRRSKNDIVQAADIPSGFDVTILADKDNQFDYDGAPLTAEDLKSALRYRKDENLPVATVLMKRGEKQKIKNEHIVALARIAYQMGIKAYIQEKSGEISEIRAQLKEPEEDKKPEAAASGTGK
jgi:hypothetical protein